MAGRTLLPVPDLLRQRRVELGLPASSPPLRPALGYVGMASGIGAILLAAVLIMYWQLLNREQTLQQILNDSSQTEQRVAKAKSRLKKSTTSAAKLEQDTEQITTQLVSLRSGSAFLEQLRRVTPVGISLQTVVVQPVQLRINGLAHPNGRADGYEQINAITLNFESLPAVPLGSAFVEKAQGTDADSTNFILQVGIDPSIKPTPQKLRELGADGLATRFEFLQKQGLPL